MAAKHLVPSAAQTRRQDARHGLGSSGGGIKDRQPFTVTPKTLPDCPAQGPYWSRRSQGELWLPSSNVFKADRAVRSPARFRAMVNGLGKAAISGRHPRIGGVTAASSRKPGQLARVWAERRLGQRPELARARLGGCPARGAGVKGVPLPFGARQYEPAIRSFSIRDLSNQNTITFFHWS
jgi:hypothetical protein